VNDSGQRKAREALQKAQGHLVAADLIASRGEYPMAFSHLVLSLEEWSKQMIYEGLSMGLVEWGTPDANNPFRIPEYMEFSHPSKQFLAAFLAAIVFPMKGRLKFVIDSGEAGRNPSKQEVTEQLKRDLEVSTKLIEMGMRLEAMKQSGLYSGDKTPKGDRMVPTSKEDFNWLRPILGEQLEIEAFVVDHPIAADQVAAERSLMKDLQERFRPLAVRLLRARQPENSHTRQIKP
jgi:hypothetical protein